jgi:hypothetical protein
MVNGVSCGPMHVDVVTRGLPAGEAEGWDVPPNEMRWNRERNFG